MAERAFIAERKRVMRTSFAKLIGVKDSEVDERDLPVVAIAGSGGGEPVRLHNEHGAELF
jgi:cytosolic phospholipase A2